MLLQLRYRYAAGFPGSLPAGDINPVRELGRSVIRPRAAARPRSTRFEPEGRLRSFNARVPCVHLPISLAAPRLSGSASPSRRCQGCCPPAPASPGAGCPQLLSGRCDSQRAKALHLRTFQWRLVAHDVGHPLGFGFQRREIPFQQIPDARRWQSRAASRPAPLPPRPALNAVVGHQARNAIEACCFTLLHQVLAHARSTDDAPAVFVDLADAGQQALVIQPPGARSTRAPAVVPAG